MTPTAVLVHGAGNDARAWDELRANLRAPALAVDLPGRRTSPGAPRASAAEAARAVLDAMTAAGVAPERAVVVGHSYGGAVALECALAAPLAGLGLVATGARLRVHPGILDGMRDDAAKGTRTAVSIGWTAAARPELVARFDDAARSVPAQTALADWQAADGFDRMTELARVACPVLVVVGTEDTLTPPKYARYLAEHLPRAELAVLEGASHMCIAEHAAAVAARLDAFVAALPAPPADR